MQFKEWLIQEGWWGKFKGFLNKPEDVPSDIWRQLVNKTGDYDASEEIYQKAKTAGHNVPQIFLYYLMRYIASNQEPPQNVDLLSPPEYADKERSNPIQVQPIERRRPKILKPLAVRKPIPGTGVVGKEDPYVGKPFQLY